MRRRRSGWAAGLGGGVVIAAGFAVALVEVHQWPKASIWLVVGAAVLLLLLIRRLAGRGR
jgi:UDP-N-acetylmuramyl pentapeptide phosphotransferase/UDP-N-acetylglucosamine-1-phosphate transferase